MSLPLRSVCSRARTIAFSFLPLSHTFERTVGYYLAIASGACTAYARSAALLMQDMQTEKPTILVCVPRIYERVHAKMLEKFWRARHPSVRPLKLPWSGGGPTFVPARTSWTCTNMRPR